MRLKDKVALVTGAGRGIGRGIAVALAREGARVVINYPFEKEEAAEVVNHIATFDGEAIAIKADIADAAQREALFEKARRQFGRLDLLVNNAAFDPGRTKLLEIDEELFDHVLGVNLKGAFFCAQLAARAMIRQGGGGRIINISSIHGQASLPDHAPYSLSKGGLNAMTRQLAMDLAPDGITVNAIAPGFIEVARTMASFERYVRAEVSAKIPIRRVGLPADIAGLVCFLASAEAGFITGQVLVCDGGTIARMAL